MRGLLQPGKAPGHLYYQEAGMIARIHLFAAALTGVLICSTAGAQVRSGTASTTATGSPTAQRPARHAKLAARPAANPAGHASTAFSSSQQAGVIQIPPSGLVSSEFLSANNSSPADSTLGVPGLGFDFPHLAAISAGLGNNPSLPFHPGGRHGQASFTPILFWGYPYYSEDAGGDQLDEPAAQPAQAQQPQIIVIQQPAPQRQDADSASDAGNAPAPAAEAEAPAPNPDAGNFILVRRDGRILFAAVFSVVGTQLQYVTPEGIRRTLEMVDLDADATQQMNEARGTMVQFRN
jgi:hypothetical protein